MIPLNRPRRKQARIDRANLKKVDADNKKIRFLEIMSDRHAPRMRADPSDIFRQPMTWCVTKSDRDGVWSWGQPRQWADHDFDNHIKITLDSLTGNTWNEIGQMVADGHFKHHAQAVGGLVPEARQRWESLEIEYEEAFRFRLTGSQRAWGYREGSHFRMVWYDRMHQIYPVEKSHT